MSYNKKLYRLSNDALTADSLYDESIGKLQSEINTSTAADLYGLVSPYYGKKFSIIGDSMSTYEGYVVPTSNYTSIRSSINITTSYPKNTSGFAGEAAVDDVNKTWWMKIIKASGGVLEKNASCSGSYVVRRSGYAQPSLYERRSMVGNPDVIIIALGRNDSSHSVGLGTYDFDTEYSNLDETTFRPALIKGIKALKNLHSNARIVYLILNMEPEYYNSAVYICTQLGVDFVFARDYTCGDSIHPDFNGMRYIASKLATTQIMYNSADSTRTIYDSGGRSIYGQLNLFNTNIDVDMTPSDNTYGNSPYVMRDRDSDLIAQVRGDHLKTNHTGVCIIGYGKYNGSRKNTYLRFGINNGNGSPFVEVGAPDAWVSAISSPVTISPTITTSTISGVTALPTDEVHCVQSGYVTTVCFQISRNTTEIAGWQTILSGLPRSNFIIYAYVMPANFELTKLSVPLSIRITTGGVLQIAHGNTLSGTATFRPCITYVSNQLLS